MQALSSDDLGSQSVAIGTSALENQNSATAVITYNTAVGYGAGDISNHRRHKTLLLVHRAGDGTDDGASNVAVGHQALSAN